VKQYKLMTETCVHDSIDWQHINDWR